MPKVKFVQEKLEIEVPAGANLRREALKAGVALYPIHPQVNCHGFGHCGQCRVLLSEATASGAEKPGWRERLRLKLSFFAIGHEKTMRLACQTRVVGDLEVTTKPAANLYGTQKTW